MADPVSKPISSENPSESTAIFNQTKTKGSVQSSFFHLKYRPLKTTGSHWVVIDTTQLAPGHCLASGSLLETTCGASATTGHVASMTRMSHEYPGQYFHQVGQSASLLSFGFMLVLGVGQTKCFLKMSN